MLYISRIVNNYDAVNKRYGVVDSDDNVETLVSKAELISLITKHRLKIDGVRLVRNKNGELSVRVNARNTNVGNVTSQQVKAKLLTGVDISVSKGEIVLISVNCDIMSDDYKIKLSDYGNKIAWDVPVVFTSSRKKGVILSFDDSISVYGELKSAPVDGRNPYIVYDISDATKSEIVDTVYNCTSRIFIMSLRRNRYMLDRYERWILRLQYEYVRVKGAASEADFDFIDAARKVPISQSLVHLTAQELEIVESAVEHTKSIEYSNYYITQLASNVVCKALRAGQFRLFVMSDFEFLRDNFWCRSIDCFSDPYIKQENISTTLQTFWRYINICSPDDRSIELFVSMCNNVAEAIHNHSRSANKHFHCRKCEIFHECTGR